MNFAGLPWTQIATTFAAASSIITALYLLRSRRKPMVVAFAPLWHQVQRKHDFQHPWRKLQRIGSWLLQVFLLALLCFALSNPQTRAWLNDPKTVAIVIDRSPSMSAASHHAPPSKPKESRFDQAKAHATAILGSLGEQDRVIVITADMDLQVPIALGPVSSSAIRSVQALTPGSGDSSLGPAIELAKQVVHQDPSAEIKVISDGAVDEHGARALKRCVTEFPNCEWIATQGPNDNVAISNFSARRYPNDRNKAQVLLEIQRLTSKPIDIQLRVFSGELELDRRKLTLPGDSVHREFFDNIDIDHPQLRAQILPMKGSAHLWGPTFDDEAWAVVLPSQPRKVVLVSDGRDLFLQAALLSLDEHIDLSFVEAKAAIDHPQAFDDSEIVIFDTATYGLPDRLPNTNVVVFDPYRLPRDALPIKKLREIQRPRITEELRSHPILKNIVFKDVNLSRGTSFVKENGDEVLLQHIDEPLLILRKQDHHMLFAGFDPRQSDIPMRIAFPLFMANVIEFMASPSSEESHSISLGRHRSIHVRDIGWENLDVDGIEIIAPNGDRTLATVQHKSFQINASQAGIHHITATKGESKGAKSHLAVNQIGINSSILASALPPPSKGSDSLTPNRHSPSPSRPIWMMLVWLTIAMISIEWATYQWRKTV